MRVSAINADFGLSQFTEPAVAACWLSHKKAISEFLETDYSHALILEDDFVFSTPEVNGLIKNVINSNLDLIQLGFLKTTFKERVFIQIENIYDRLIRIYSLAVKFPSKLKHSEKTLITERVGLSARFVMNDLRPGAHGYIVNKKAARYILALNDPIFLSTDDLFKSLGNMRYIRMARLRRSAISQAGLVSSINPR
jgi:GR25 family glycosyltransferase involved in LPS biosynthesis